MNDEETEPEGAAANDEDDAHLRSRTDIARARKAEEARLSALAADLVALPKKQFDRLEVDEAIASAVKEVRRMTTHSARARQLRVVRRELRDADSRAIAASLTALVRPSGHPTPTARAATAWVERLLEGNGDAVEAFLAAHEQADRQRLKALIRNVRKAKDGKVAKARKTLVNAVRALLDEG